MTGLPAIIEAVRRGDHRAAEAFVRAHQDRVFAYLSRLLGPRGQRAEVEDLAQMTFLRALDALPRFDPSREARVSTWVLTIATRLALDHQRRSARSPFVFGRRQADAPQPGPDPAEQLLGSEAQRRVVAAVEALAPAWRAAFLLRVEHDLEYAEIARILRCDVGTAKSRVSRARQALREVLGRDGEEETAHD